jgi:hypothetical protein
MYVLNASTSVTNTILSHFTTQKMYFNIIFPSTHTSFLLPLFFETSKTYFILISYFVRATYPACIIVLGFVIPVLSLSLSLSLSIYLPHTYMYLLALQCFLVNSSKLLFIFILPLATA